MVILPVNHAIVWGIVIEKVESTSIQPGSLATMGPIGDLASQGRVGYVDLRVSTGS